MKKQLIILVLCLAAIQAQAQQELNLFLNTDVDNHILVNPSYMPDSKWTVSLPTIGFGMMHTGPTFTDFFSERSDGSYWLDIQDDTDNLAANNIFASAFKWDLIGGAYSWEKNTVHFSYSMNVDAAINYTAEGAMILANGNGPYIDRTMSVGPAIDIQAYDKLGIGYSRKVNRWSLGGRLNFLFGKKALVTEEHDATITTEGDYYGLTLNTNYKFNTSGFMDIDMATNDVTFEEMKYNIGPSGNGFGVGIDFGLGYEIDSEKDVYFSVLNLGKINWNTEARSYSSYGERSYDGVYIQSLVNLDTASLSGMLDSIQQFVNLEENEGSFSTSLSPRVMLGGDWRLDDTKTVSTAIDVSWMAQRIMPAVALGYRHQVAHWVNVGGTVAYQNRRLNHLGLNSTLELGPVQILLASDNVLAFVLPKTASNMQFRLGMNLRFQENLHKHKGVIYSF